MGNWIRYITLENVVILKYRASNLENKAVKNKLLYVWNLTKPNFFVYIVSADFADLKKLSRNSRNTRERIFNSTVRRLKLNFENVEKHGILVYIEKLSKT